jgi:hypothetical protein
MTPQALDVLAEPWRSARPIRVEKNSRVAGLGIGGDPVGDALTSHAEPTGDVGSGAAAVELQDGQGAAVQPSVAGLGQLPLQTPALVVGQLELAHGISLPTQGLHEQMSCQKTSAGLLSTSYPARQPTNAPTGIPYPHRNPLPDRWLQHFPSIHPPANPA